MRRALLTALALAACQHTETSAPHVEATPAGPGSGSASGSALCEQMRARAETQTRDDLMETDRGKRAAPAARAAAVHAFADLMVAQCTTDHWAATKVDCMVKTDGDHCGLSRDENRKFNKAVDAAWTAILGPDPAPDALEEFARYQNELAKQKEAARANAGPPGPVDAGARAD